MTIYTWRIFFSEELAKLKYIYDKYLNRLADYVEMQSLYQTVSQPHKLLCTLLFFLNKNR